MKWGVRVFFIKVAKIGVKHQMSGICTAMVRTGDIRDLTAQDHWFSDVSGGSGW